MDKELFIIEMLSAKPIMIANDKQNKRKTFFILCMALLADIVFFWGIGTLVYFKLKFQVRSLLYIFRIKYLYYFSLSLGTIIGIVLLIFFIINVRDSIFIRRNFSKWLEKQAEIIDNYPVVFAGKAYYYLAKQDWSEKKIRIKKTPIQLIPTIIDDSKVYLGKKEGFAGTTRSQLFILKPYIMPIQDENTLKSNLKLFGSLALVVVIMLVGTIYYSIYQYTAILCDDEMTTTTETSDSVEAIETNGMISQIGNPPDITSSQLFELTISDSDELYQTTNGGTTWEFVPIKVDWLRAGQYTTTDGEPPLGYWLDNTFQVGEDFSWYVYSPDNLNLYFLNSMDNGQTWNTTIVSDTLSKRLRYRKANFLNPGEVGEGRGYIAYSLFDPVVSQESLQFFYTDNYGQTWQFGIGALFNQPIQNASFISNQIGFVSIRDSVYYTNDGGLNYDESVISPPEGYAKGGLNIFDSPNDVTQLNSTTYRAVFNFTKTGNFEGNQMDSWIYQSIDGGASWQVVEKGNQIRINQ